jgi:large subunit ribosomal protein L21
MSRDVYAVIRTGGKQYRVSPGQRLAVERLDGVDGDEITFDDVLLVRDDVGAVAVGAPLVEGASVTAEIAAQRRAKKILVFKYKNKTRYRKLRGHRQHLTDLRISQIALGDRSWKSEPRTRPVEVEVSSDDAEGIADEEE